MFEFLAMAGNYEDRKVANDEDIDGGSVDTCAVTDSSKPFETAIQHPRYHDGMWIIVELYNDRAAAEDGHRRWVETLRGRPTELRDVNESALEGFANALGGTTRGVYTRDA